MKRALAASTWLAALVGVLLALPVLPQRALALPPAPNTESLPNGDVEDFDPLLPGEPVGWEANSWGDPEATFTWLDATITPGVSHTGNHALRVDVVMPNKPADQLQGDAKWWSQPFETTDSTGHYQVSQWYRSNIPTRIVFWVSDGAGKEEYMNVKTVPAAEAWTQVTASVALPHWVKQMRIMQVVEQTGWLVTDTYSAIRAPSPVKHPALVSLTFDDGWVTAYAYLVNQMDKRGIKGTHFIITEYMDKVGYTADYIGSKKVKELLGGGHEVGSHTLLHEDMSKVTPEILNENLELSKVRLENLGAKVVSFAWPYGFYLPEQADRAQQTYNLVRTVKPGLNIPPYNTKEILGFVVTPDTTVEQIESAVEEAEDTDGAWLILIYHRADENPPNDAFVTPASFTATLDMLQAHQADIRPMGSILGLWEPVPLPVEPTKVLQCCKAFDPPETFQPIGSTDDELADDGGCGAGRVPSAGPAALVLLALLGGVVRRRREGASS